METLTNLANQGKIAKLKLFKVKPASKLAPLQDAIQQHLKSICQHFFRQNSMNQDLSKFNNAKVSGFTVHCPHLLMYKFIFAQEEIGFFHVKYFMALHMYMCVEVK